MWTTMVGQGSNLYPPFTPTVHEQVEYEKTAQRLLDSTVQHYQLFNFHYHREMNRKRWKAVKTREYMTVYKERNPLPVEQCDVGRDWKDPKLLVATGTIVGQLDEVMYGVVTPDAESMLLKASITKNRLVGGAVLTQIHGPTIREPFRFLGVKWFVMAPPTVLNGMIWARDAVFIESTGITTLPNGDRIGYQLMQSADIPGYGQLDPQHSIVRGRVSSCSIFKQLANGTVDVYVRGYVEAFGKVMDSVALKTVASGFLSSWNSVGCAQYKKFIWCVQHPLCRRSSSEYDVPDNTASMNGAGLTHNHRCCASCNKQFGKFSSAEMCILCKQWMCSKCRVVSKVRRVDNELCLDEKDATICKACVEHVDELDTFKIATQEIRSGRFAPKRSPPMIKLWSFRGRRNSGDGRRDSSMLLPADRNAGFSVDRSAATSSSEGMQLFDPTQLYNSSKSHDHSSDADEHDDAAAIVAVASAAAAATPHSSDYYFDRYPRRSRSPDLTPSEYEDEADDEYEHFAGKLNYVPQHFQAFGVSTIDDVYNDDQNANLESRVASPVPSPPPRRNPPNAAEDFWKQLQTLRATTEQTYQMTLQTTNTHIQRDKSRKIILYP